MPPVLDRLTAPFRFFRPFLAAENPSRGRVIALALAGVCVLALLITSFVAGSLREQRHEQLGRSTAAVLRIADKIEHDLAGLDNAQREYLLTGAEASLQAFADRRAALENRLVQLRSMTSHDGERLAAIDQLRDNFDAWVQKTAEPQMEARQQGRETSGMLTRTRSRSTLDAMRLLLAEFSTLTTTRFDQSSAHGSWHRLAQTGGLACFGLLAVGLVCAPSWSKFAIYRRHLESVASAQAHTRTIIAATPDAVITTDPQGHIAFVNPAGEKMFGRTGEQMVGQPISLLIPECERFHTDAPVDSGTHRASGMRGDGNVLHLEFSLSTLPHEDGPHAVAILRDITERSRSEETLKHISLGVNGATGAEFVKSLVRHLSRALHTEFAFVVEFHQRTVAPFSTLTLSERGEIHSVGAFDLTGTACAEVLTKGGVTLLSGARLQHPIDSLLAGLGIEAMVALPLSDSQGCVVGIVGVLHRQPVQDAQVIESVLQTFATRAAAELARKQSIEQLAGEKERLAATVRSVAEGFVTTDREGRILTLNTAAERLTGWSQEDACNRPVADVLHLADAVTHLPCGANLDQAIASGTPVTGQMLLTSRDGSERLVETTSTPLRDGVNRTAGTVLVMRDVTAKARAEEERRKTEKLESLGVAAGGIAHDFNNLLTAILGNLSLALYSSHLDEQLSARLVAAKRASLRAQELAQQLLTFARGGAPVKQSVSIAQLVRDSASLSLRDSNVRTEFSIADDLWPAEVDAGQISQVLSNILVNAEQAMPAGGSLRISCANFALAQDNLRLRLSAARYVKITIHDEGIGIPEENLKKIFDPYFSTKPKGTGLGLATAYSIMKSHDGVIDVVSQAGEGTTFYLFLRATDKAVEVKPAEIAPPSPIVAARILVLDDEEDICALVRCALAPLGYDVTEATDALLAIRLYQEALQAGNRFDLVISDLTLPGGMGGQEAVRRMREIDPEVKAIVSSGYAMDPVVSRYREHGFCGMIAKPYELDALGRVVAETLAAKPVPKVIHHDFDTRKSA